MRPILLVLTLCFAFAGKALGQDSTSKQKESKEAEIQEQYVFLAAKVKNIAEVQDLILQQQQLLLNHLDTLKKTVEQLEHDRTNLIQRAEWKVQLAELDRWRKQTENLQQTNLDTVTKLVSNLQTRLNQARAATNIPPPQIRYPYLVQNGDTLSRIVTRWNEALDGQGIARVTQEQIERANPRLSPDKIKVGQILFIPVVEAKP